MSPSDKQSPPQQEQNPRQETRPPDLNSSDPYAVLGLMRGASPRQIKRAYFAQVREHSPEDDPDSFKLIRAAYEKLRTDKVKEETDLFLFRPPYPWDPRKRKIKFDLDVQAEDIWILLRKHGDLGQKNFQKDYRGVPL